MKVYFYGKDKQEVTEKCNKFWDALIDSDHKSKKELNVIAICVFTYKSPDNVIPQNYRVHAFCEFNLKGNKMPKLKKKNTFETLSKISGISKKEIKRISEGVLKNNKLLNGCSFHNFEQIDDPHLSRRFKCSNCGGVVDATKKIWYEKELNKELIIKRTSQATGIWNNLKIIKGGGIMKWSELKSMVDELLEKETKEENKDPEISVIDVSAGSMTVNPEIIIGIENGELEIF